ncbi:MAG: hypothetical protein Q7J57_02135 [Gemmobacter sp.]|nr:hypothetical protein [Gemmobacter sp.]
MEALGRAVKLIAPQDVRPFVKRQKNDVADAEATAIAARQAAMRFVQPRTIEQQSHAALFRGRERLGHQRTVDVNALRALLHEHGHVFPIGLRYLDRMAALVDDKAFDLTDVVAVHQVRDSDEPLEIGRATPAALAALDLAPGSMGPKVSAAAFVITIGQSAGIGQLSDARAILEDRAGARVLPDPIPNRSIKPNHQKIS